MNLSGSWIEKCGIEEYRRVGPCGPIIPLLIVVTTLHGRMFLDVTYRTASFAAIDARTIAGVPAAIVDGRGRLRTTPDQHGLECFFGAVFERKP